MSNSPWLARLKNEGAPELAPTEPTKAPMTKEAAGFVGFAGVESQACPNSAGTGSAANDVGSPGLCDQYASECEDGDDAGAQYPQADVLAARMHWFSLRGMGLDAAEALAKRLALRDSDLDDRRLCLECSYLGAQGRCIAAATGRLSGVSARLEPLQTILQRCEAFGLRKGLA
jgi:hypothetical protein